MAIRNLTPIQLFNAKNNSMDTDDILDTVLTVTNIGHYEALVQLKGEQTPTMRTLYVLAFDDGTVWSTPSIYAGKTIEDIIEYSDLAGVDEVKVRVSKRGANGYLTIELVE